MKTKGNTVLITGGATGIGFSLAEAFVNAGNKVIICGRREYKLNEAKGKLPQIYTKVCDVSKKKDRESLFEWVKENFIDLNILINNAGIQNTVNFQKGTQDLSNVENEIETNFVAQIYLSSYFTPLFLKKKEAAIINMSSGLAFVPIAAIPIYCATKAAIHSYTMSLRYQLRDTPIRVFEIMPPPVDTEMGKGTSSDEEQGYRSIPPFEVADATLKALANNDYEILIGEVKDLLIGTRTNLEETFEKLNKGPAGIRVSVKSLPNDDTVSQPKASGSV